jgi:hypothetical protein
MTFSFKNDNDIIVYALEKVVSYASRFQHVFLAQCVWWLASVIGLEQELVTFIDIQHSRYGKTVWPESSGVLNTELADPDQQQQRVKTEESAKEESDRQKGILNECEALLQDSRHLQRIARLKASRKSKTGRNNQTKHSKETLRVARKHLVKNSSKTEGIEVSEIDRRKPSGECLRCAWPADRKGTHRVKDCIRPIKLDRGNDSYPKNKSYQQLKTAISESSDYDSTVSETDRTDRE